MKKFVTFVAKNLVDVKSGNSGKFAWGSVLSIGKTWSPKKLTTYFKHTLTDEVIERVSKLVSDRGTDRSEEICAEKK